MALIPFNKVFTTQSDFEDLQNTNVNVDTSTTPGSVILPRTSTQNIQVIDHTNFGQGILTNLVVDGNNLKLDSFQSHFINVVPVRTTTLSEDSLQLAFAPILAGSLILKADGLTLIEGTDYNWVPSTGKITLFSSLSPSTLFEASYTSQGILECEGTYESPAIAAGDEATQLILSNIGTDLSSTTVYIKQAETELLLSSAPYLLIDINNPIVLLISTRFIQLKLDFTPINFTISTIPVTFKYNEDWNLAGSSFDNTVINNQHGIEISSSSNSIVNTTSLPVPTTLAGADAYTDFLTSNSYLVVTGGYESPTTLGRSTRIAQINTNGLLGPWMDTALLPAPSAPYNGTKTVNINGKTYVYTLNNNNSTSIYRTVADSHGVLPWTTENPLPKALYRANLEILKDDSTQTYFLIVQNEANIYWIKINNLDGSLLGNWRTYKLSDMQEAASTVLIPSTNAGTYYLYVLGGVIQDSVQKTTTNKINKIVITKTGSNLFFNASYTLQKLPKALSYFTSEFITMGSDKYLYIFGGTTQTDTFGDGNTDSIQRIKIDLSSGDFLEAGFSQSPNKLYTPSSGLNTVLVSDNLTNNVYVIGDSNRSSSRTSKINILTSVAAIQTGTYTSGIFQVPGCNLQYNAFNLSTSLFNVHQSVNAFYRISDTQDNLLTASWVPVSNNDNLIGSSDARFIQFQFVLNRNPANTVEEQSPTLNNFTFTFTSHISTVNQSPTYTSSTLTFDNFLYQSSGSITLRYDSESNNTTYTDIVSTLTDFVADESMTLLFRTVDNLPLTGPFFTLDDLHSNDAGGRYIEVEISLTASTNLLFGPVLQDVSILGLQPEVTNTPIGEFVIDEAPLGAQDMINTHFTTNFTFEPGSLEVYVNGQKQTRPLIFTENIDQTSFDFVSYAPDSLDVIRVNYIKTL